MSCPVVVSRCRPVFGGRNAVTGSGVGGSQARSAAGLARRARQGDATTTPHLMAIVVSCRVASWRNRSLARSLTQSVQRAPLESNVRRLAQRAPPDWRLLTLIELSFAARCAFRSRAVFPIGAFRFVPPSSFTVGEFEGDTFAWGMYRLFYSVEFIFFNTYTHVLGLLCAGLNIFD